MLTGLAFLLAAAGSCNHDPSVVKLADTNVPAAYYKTLSGSRIAVVAVTLDAGGKVTAASIYQSSGSDVLDRSALDAAKRSTYTPGETNCLPSGGTFAVQLSFDGDIAPAKDKDCPHEARALTTTVPRPSQWPWTPSAVQVAVAVTIAPDGQLLEARIAQSSGNMAMDQAALTAARQSTYEPKTIAIPVRRQAGAGSQNTNDGVACKSVTGTYLFRVTFEPNRW